MTENKTLAVMGVEGLTLGGVKYAAFPSHIVVAKAGLPALSITRYGQMAYDCYTVEQLHEALIHTPVGVYTCANGEFAIDSFLSLAHSTVYAAKFLSDNIPEWMMVERNEGGNGVTINDTTVTTLHRRVVCESELCAVAVAIRLGAAQ